MKKNNPTSFYWFMNLAFGLGIGIVAGLAVGCTADGFETTHPIKSKTSIAARILPIPSSGLALGGKNEVPKEQIELPLHNRVQFLLSDSTSMAAPQRYKDGAVPQGSLQEFVNYYDPDHYRDWFEGESWALKGSMMGGVQYGLKAVHSAPVEDVSGEVEEGALEGQTQETLELLFQMRAGYVTDEYRRNWNIFFCVDLSEAMADGNLEIVKEALIKSLKNIWPEDRLTLVTFNEHATVVFQDLEFSAHQETIEAAFNELQTGSTADMSAGLNQAYDLAQEFYDPDMLNRVLLFSAGAANVSDEDIESFAGLTRIDDRDGIYLSALGVGYDHDGARLDRLSDAGKGAHVFLPNIEEVTQILDTPFYTRKPFRKLMEVRAEKVAIEMILPEGLRLEGAKAADATENSGRYEPNVILTENDDITFLVRFIVEDQAALEEAATLKVSFKLISSGQEIVLEQEVERVLDLVREPGFLFHHTQGVIDFAKIVSAETVDTVKAEELMERLANQFCHQITWSLEELSHLLYELLE